MSQPLRIAVTKGRIMDEALVLLDKAGIVVDRSAADDDRSLQLHSECGNYLLFVIRGADATHYVRLGAADAGIVGKDMLLETGSEGLYELLDLNIARCRLMTAAPKQALDGRRGPLRVAAKLINTARRFYAEQGVQARFIELYGSLELAPNIGISDEIVDLVDSGKTLASNGLEPRQLIADISSRLIVNKAAMRTRHRRICDLLAGLKRAKP